MPYRRPRPILPRPFVIAWQLVTELAPQIISIFSRHSRMLENPASFVLDSSKSSTGTRPPHHSAARTHVVLLIRRTVRPRGYASGLHSLRPCPRNGASLGEEVALATSGRAGEVTAGVERVRCLAFLSILREGSPVRPHIRAIEGLTYKTFFHSACWVD